MSEYEITEILPHGVRVDVYFKRQRVDSFVVPAAHCQTRQLLENYVKRYAADKIKETAIPADVRNITGKQPL